MTCWINGACQQPVGKPAASGPASMIVASRSRWLFVSFRGRPPRHRTRSPATPSSRNARSQAYTVDGLTPTPAAISVTGSSRAIPSSAVTRLTIPRSPALNARLKVASSALRVSVVIRMLTVDIVGSWFGLTSSSLPTMSLNFPECSLSPEGFLKVYTFLPPDLGSFCPLDELGPRVVGQRLEPGRAVAVD